MTEKRTNVLPAFTIVEMIVVLLLTMITAAMAYFMFDKVNLSYRSFQKNQAQMHQLTLFGRLLATDFAKADSLKNEDSHLATYIDGQVIHYQVSETSIIRRQSLMSDTLVISEGSAKFFFKEVALEAIPQLVDRCIISFTQKEQQINWEFQKNYATSVWMR